MYLHIIYIYIHMCVCDLCTCVDLKLCHILSCLSAIVFRPVSDQCPRHSGPWLTLSTLPVKVREPNIAEFTMDTSDALQPNSPFRLFVYVFETQLLNINRGTVLRRPEEVSMFLLDTSALNGTACQVQPRVHATDELLELPNYQLLPQLLHVATELVADHH